MRSDARQQREIAAIDDLSRDELADGWEHIYGCRPPVGVRRELLAYAAAWHLQAKHVGGHSAQTRKAIKDAVARITATKEQGSKSRASVSLGVAITDGQIEKAHTSSTASATNKPPAKRSRPRPGARIIREWNGKINIVDVIEGGFHFEGEEYRSLSAIARKITSARWSGPRFFGL